MVFNFILGIQEVNKEKVKVNCREAVRGIIIRNGELLMVNSNKGDYKFPGGGVKSGENHSETLIREVREETGYIISKVKERIGIIIERNIDEFEKDSIFEMVSHYYVCEVLESQVELELDDYETELDFCPQWINIDTVINKNERILKIARPDINHWVHRETAVLHELKAIIT
ncbi:MAG: hypothetical protein A2Y23_12950 [Clostridiales bacterium GWB2_37_7]|nr:MAG: hypothetical protein A2Y23_12950 [Clostridiales bacterium GWB2_37_7]